ncbi:hypothetical protein, partial [Streptococcus pneumoniae]|uniref:hypothetical protein n=1 Tax=Streptococcus pneumoniae TaxID=1313 RepID=UPI001E38AC04
KKEVASSYTRYNGSEIYSSEDDELYGNLYYDKDDNTENWVYLGATTSVGSIVQKKWFFQLTGGTWSDSGKATKAE